MNSDHGCNDPRLTTTNPSNFSVSYPYYTKETSENFRNNPFSFKGLLPVLLERVRCLGLESIPDDGGVVLAVQHREQDRAQFGRLLEVQSDRLAVQGGTQIAEIFLRTTVEHVQSLPLHLPIPSTELLHPPRKPRDERRRHRGISEDGVDCFVLSNLQHFPDRLGIQ